MGKAVGALDELALVGIDCQLYLTNQDVVELDIDVEVVAGGKLIS